MGGGRVCAGLLADYPEERMIAYSEPYEAALVLAAQAHRDQSRKGTGIPYIVHPVIVSTILLRHGYAEQVVIAGLLHDVVEDQDVSLVEIEARFGSAVAGLVAALSERKEEGGRRRPWPVRKQEALAQLRSAGPEAAAVKAADVIHNARSLAVELRRRGPSAWADYSRGPEESLWYYRSVVTIVREHLDPQATGTQPLVVELEEALRDLERAVTCSTS